MKKWEKSTPIEKSRENCSRVDMSTKQYFLVKLSSFWHKLTTNEAHFFVVVYFNYFVCNKTKRGRRLYFYIQQCCCANVMITDFFHFVFLRAVYLSVQCLVYICNKICNHFPKFPLAVVAWDRTKYWTSFKTVQFSSCTATFTFHFRIMELANKHCIRFC